MYNGFVKLSCIVMPRSLKLSVYQLKFSKAALKSSCARYSLLTSMDKFMFVELRCDILAGTFIDSLKVIDTRPSSDMRFILALP